MVDAGGELHGAASGSVLDGVGTSSRSAAAVGLWVLGPVQLVGPGGAVAVGDRKTRQVLTVLALRAGRPMSTAALVESLWDDPPQAAVKTVQAHVSRVRSALAAAGAGALVGGSPGYALDVDALDVRVVADLRRRARVAALDGHHGEAAALLCAARGLWQGDPELPVTAAGDAERLRLAEERVQLTEDHLDAVVAAARPADALAELAELTRRHPLRERGWALLMTALYRCGRQADALAAYRTVRMRLRDELGVDPGPELRALEAAVLAHALPDPPASATRPLDRSHAGAPHPPALERTGTAPPNRSHAGALDPSVGVVSSTRSVARAGVPLAETVDIGYADADGVHIAWTTFGAGPVDVLLLHPTFVPVDAYLEEPHLARAVTRLAEGRRAIVLDRRGLGLSDPVGRAAPLTIAHWMHDAIAVLDAARADPVHVLANDHTALVALLLAARHPDRVASLTLVNAYARFGQAPDYPHGEPAERNARTLRDIRTHTGPPPVDVLTWIAPSVAADPAFRRWWDAVGRRGASPGTAELVHRAILDGDVRAELPRVAAPVRLVSRLDCASYDPGHARYLAEHLPRATLVEYPDPDGPWFLGAVDVVLAQLAEASTAQIRR